MNTTDNLYNFIKQDDENNIKVSSLKYGNQTQLIADNRQTSLFKDYYKVIGSRYKYTLENLVANLSINN